MTNHDFKASHNSFNLKKREMIVPGICNFLNYNLWFICQKVSQKSRALWTDKRFMRLRSSRRNIKPFISIPFICSIVWQLGNVQMHQVYEIFILWIKFNLKSRTSCFRQRDVTIGLQVKCSSPFTTNWTFQIQTPQYEFQNTIIIFQEAFTSILRKALCCKREKGDQVDDRFVRSVLEEAEDEEDGDNGDDGDGELF